MFDKKGWLPEGMQETNDMGCDPNCGCAPGTCDGESMPGGGVDELIGLLGEEMRSLATFESEAQHRAAVSSMARALEAFSVAAVMIAELMQEIAPEVFEA